MFIIDNKAATPESIKIINEDENGSSTSAAIKQKAKNKYTV